MLENKIGDFDGHYLGLEAESESSSDEDEIPSIFEEKDNFYDPTIPSPTENHPSEPTSLRAIKAMLRCFLSIFTCRFGDSSSVRK